MYCALDKDGRGIYGSTETKLLVPITVPGGVTNTAEHTQTLGEKGLLIRFGAEGGWRYSAMTKMTQNLCELFGRDPDGDYSAREKRAWMRCLFREVATSGIPQARAFIVAE